MAPKDPKQPWSEDQNQSVLGGPPDYRPWRLTLAAIAILILLLVGGYFLWRSSGQEKIPAPPSPTAAG